MDYDITVLIGVAGGTASGKTTFADRLQGKIPHRAVTILHLDRYFRKPLPKTRAPFSEREFEDYNHPNSFRIDDYCQDLLQLKQSGQYEVVIAEGLMVLQAPCIRELLDLKVFIDAMADERIVRRLRRNMERGLDFEDITEFYLDSVRYRHNEFVEPSRWHADVVVNGNNPAAKCMQMLQLWIEQELSR